MTGAARRRGGRVQLLEVAHVAHRLSCCQETVRRYIRTGRLRAVRLHTGKLRVPETAVDEYLASLEPLQHPVRGGA